MNGEKSVRTDPLRVVFCKQWTVSKEESGGSVLQPWIRMLDGTFKPFEAGFQMNRFGVEELIGQLKNLLASITGEAAPMDRLKTRADADTGAIEIISTLPSGQQYSLRMSAPFARSLAADLEIAATHVEKHHRPL